MARFFESTDYTDFWGMARVLTTENTESTEVFLEGQGRVLTQNAERRTLNAEGENSLPITWN